MNNKIKASVLIGIFALLTLLDLILTRIATPNLSMEGNPLVRVLGLGWFALIASNILILALYAVVVWYSFVVYKRPHTTADSFLEFCANVKSEKGSSIFLAVFGYAISYTMILGRLLPVIEWAIYVAGYRWVAYERLKQRMLFGRPDLWVMAILAIALSLFWYVKEYTANKKQQEGLS